MENDDRKWEILQSEYLIKRPWLTARRDRVRLPNGAINDEYYVLEYPDWVNVIAITKEGDFLMERQYRHGLQWTGYELCAGVCEAGEDPLESARRELYEETGYAGGEWVKHMTISANTSTIRIFVIALWQREWSVYPASIWKKRRIFRFISFRWTRYAACLRAMRSARR